MKTIGRILIILTVFAIVMGMTYVAVNASSSSASTPQFAFERGSGERAEFPGGEQREFHGEGRGAGWLFGAIKNVGLIAVIVTIVVWPKNLLQKRKRTAQK